MTRRAQSTSERPARSKKRSTKRDPLAIAHEEQELCDEIVSHLKSRRPTGPPPPTADDQALISLRDQVATSRLEDVAALVTQMEQIAAVASRRGLGNAEPVNPLSPYFGHLRLDEKERGSRDVLIGRTTYIEPREGIRIVDWRHAPVSQLYYRYEEGSPYEEQFGDREVEGVVKARRTLTIIDGELQRVTAPQGLFVRSGDSWTKLDATTMELAGGEGSAVRAEHLRGRLGAAGGAEQRLDRHLPEIAALLDSKQFEVISSPDSGLVVVQGGAGSGKTTIGVHRMAYLAYQSRARFSSDRMLVVVGTPALRDYIGQLLSALGLGAVLVVTFESWARKMRQRAYHWLKLPVEDNTPVEVARLKTAPALMKLMAERAEQLRAQQHGTAEDALWLWAEVLTDRDRLVAAFAADDANQPPAAGAASTARAETRLTEEQLDRAWRYCADRCPAVLDWTPDDDLVGSRGERIEGADGLVEQEDERAILDPEDDALLLYAHQLLRGPLRSRKRKPLRYEHLFVDEAQDLAAVDLCVLSGIVSDQKSITLAGDTAQRLYVDTGFRDWDEVLDALNLDHTAIEPLRIAYRSTREVLAFARDVLGHLAEEVPPIAPRSGAPVEHHNFPSAGAAAAFVADALRPLMLREPRATVAILTRYPEQAEAYHAVLRMAEIPNLRLVNDFDFAFRPGVDVTEVRQVKGLEYDYVILADVNASSYPDNDEARYQLHIGATRAAHQLWVISSANPSPLLPASLLEDG